MNQTLMLMRLSAGMLLGTLAAPAADFFEALPTQPVGSVTSLAITPQGRIYAGTHRDGVQVSADRGRTWKNVSAGLPVMTLGAIAVGPKGEIVVATEEPQQPKLGRVFVSTDEGKRWTPTDALLSTNAVKALAYDADGRLFAGAGWGPGGVFRSMNHGRSWQQTSLKTGIVLSLVIAKDGTLWAGTENDGVFRSTDHGDTWTAMNQGLPTPGDIWGIGVTAEGGVFLGKSGPRGEGDGVYGLTRNDQWSAAGLNAEGPCTGFYAAPNGFLLAGMKQTGIQLSTNHGRTWTKTNVTGPATSFALDAEGYLYVGNARGGIQRSRKPVGPALVKK